MKPKWQVVKWELVLAIVGLFGLAFWIVGGEELFYHYDDLKRPGAEITGEVRVGNSRGKVEVLRVEGQEPTLRILFRDHGASPPMTPEEFINLLGEKRYRDAVAPRTWVFAILNTTSWGGVIWVCVGFVAQVAFTGRVIVQWLVSERERRSVVPASYWWISLFGGIVLFAYFGWRQDLVAILGQAPGIVVYGRNLRLLYKHRRREARAAAAGHGAPA